MNKIYNDDSECALCGDGTIATWNYPQEGLKLCDEHAEKVEEN